ncbi:unnamed protein product, partial [Brassica oleracea]
LILSSILAEFSFLVLIGLNKVPNSVIHLFHFVSSLNWCLADHFMMGYDYDCLELYNWSMMINV